MPNPTPQEGRCNAKTRNPKGWFCGNYPSTDDDGNVRNGRCRRHGGEATGPTGHANALKHGMYSDPDLMYHRLSDEHKQEVDNLAEALITRLEQRRGKVDALDINRCETIARSLYKETLADDELARQFQESGSWLIEEYEQVGEQGTYMVREPSRLIRAAAEISQQNRMWLKDMGLLDSSEDRAADAMTSLASLLHSEDK